MPRQLTEGLLLKSSRKQVFAVYGFIAARGGYAVTDPRPAHGERSALRLAERLAEQGTGALAFYREGDPEIGEFDEPVEVGRFGHVPAEIEMMLLRI